MAYTKLSALHPNDHYATICVCVTRKWEYRGPADDGEIQHVDLVLADHEANTIHAEIPQELLHELNNQIQENHIYEIRRFRVANAKSFYKPVDGPHMIRFTVHTEIMDPTDPPPAFPRYSYRLTPFEQLPMLVGNIQNFLDVLGVITEISEIQPLQLSNNYAPAPTRKLVLRDVSGLETRMTLWGHNATIFSVEGVYNSEEAKPVIVLFVGCLMKTYRGQDYLSGSSACKWYFNPDIPQAEEFYNRFAGERIKIRRIAPAPPQVALQQPPPQQETRYLRELLSINPYDFPRNGCRCTVTITRLIPNVSWWFASCVRCGKACTPDTNGYICYTCNSNNYKHKFKLLFVASDGTAEAEMICFGQVAQRIIGKPVEQVMRTIRHSEDFPPDIAGVVSQKYTFAVTMANQSFYTQNKSFMVNSIITSYGKQQAIPQAATGPCNRRVGYYRGSSASASARNAAGYSRRRTPPPATLSSTPPHSPASTEAVAKDAPLLDHVETPETHSARKRLAYDTTVDEEQSDDDQRKKRRLAKMKATAESTEECSATEIPPKRSPPDLNKTSGQKTADSGTSRSQKNK